MMRLIVETDVKAVERRSRAGKAERVGEKWSVPQVDAGWFIVLEGNVAIGVGPAEPEIKAGRVRLIIEQG